MSHILLPVLAAFVSFGQAAAADGSLYPQRPNAPIIVISPPEGAVMPLAEGEFILGSVSDPSAPLRINAATVTVRSNGAFLAWLPISIGSFTFQCQLDLKNGTTSFARHIFVTAPAAVLPAKPLAIETDSLWPKSDTELRPGDWMAFQIRASPGGRAQCRLSQRDWQDLREAGPGLYEAMQAVGSGDSAAPAAVECRLRSGWSSVRAFSRARVSLSSGPPPVAVVKNNATLHSGPGGGYMAFPWPGTRLALAGRVGGEYKVSLSPTLEGWIDAKDVELLPPDAPLPRAVTGSMRTSATDHGAQVHIGLTERVAYTVDEEGGLNALTLRLYNCIGHTNWIVYDAKDHFVQELRWKQEASGVVAVTIRLDPARTLWGWQASYEGTTLRLDLRRAPDLAPAPASPLKGLRVVLDPGHMPSAPGATGPLGTREMDANYAIATAAAGLFARRGAHPVLTRASGNDEVGLAERPRLATERKGDIFVSIHNNALGDGDNPFSRPRGFEVFYYHPHSLALARQMYAAYSKRVPLPGEDLRFGNLLVARLSAMPAILVESAYMIIPEQEEKLNEPAFRGILAESLVAGVESFLEAERAKQQAGRSAGRAAAGTASNKAPAHAARKVRIKKKS